MNGPEYGIRLYTNVIGRQVLDKLVEPSNGSQPRDSRSSKQAGEDVLWPAAECEDDVLWVTDLEEQHLGQVCRRHTSPNLSHLHLVPPPPPGVLSLGCVGDLVEEAGFVGGRKMEHHGGRG